MNDKFCWNGSLVSPDKADGGAWAKLNRLRAENYVYQDIRTSNHSPLFLAEHLDIIDRTLKDMYGISFDRNPEHIACEIKKMLKANRFHNKSNVVTLYVFPKGDYMIEHSQQLYYDDFVVWHKKPGLEVFPCEYLFMGYTTAVSKITSNYATSFAENSGAEVAVTENAQGVLTNVNDEPLFIAFGDKVFTSPLETGAVNSLMRGMIIDACRMGKLEITETPVTRDMLKQCDEAFTASPQGIVSIQGWREKAYFNLTPGKLIQHLNKRLSH